VKYQEEDMLKFGQLKVVTVKVGENIISTKQYQLKNSYYGV